MSLNNIKIHIILLLTITLSWQSCSMDDDDDVDSTPNSAVFSDEYCINLPGVDDVYMRLDTIERDTLRYYPFSSDYYRYVMRAISMSQGIVKRIVSSLDAAVVGNKQSTWMSYYSPALGVYSSSGDSRSKQWNLISDVIYEDENWDYCLRIYDMPDGNNKSDNSELALEFYYNTGFNKGVILFSPTDYDAVGFPVKIFGTEITGKFRFSNTSGTVINELYLTNVGAETNVKRVRNVYLRLLQVSNTVSIEAMLELPDMWFTNKNNVGYTISAVGAFDNVNTSTVLYSGFVPSSSNDKDVRTLVTTNSAGKILLQYLEDWLTRENSVVSADDYDEVLFDTPGYYFGSEPSFEGDGNVGNSSQYSRALDCARNLLGGEFPLSPYSNSVNRINWAQTAVLKSNQ